MHDAHIYMAGEGVFYPSENNAMLDRSGLEHHSDVEAPTRPPNPLTNAH